MPVPLVPTEISMLGVDRPRAPEPLPAEEAANDRNTWDRIRDGMDLQYPDKKQVRRSIEWYLRNQEYLHRVTQRARPYLAYIVREVEKARVAHGVRVASGG